MSTLVFSNLSWLVMSILEGSDDGRPREPVETGNDYYKLKRVYIQEDSAGGTRVREQGVPPFGDEKAKMKQLTAIG